MYQPNDNFRWPESKLGGPDFKKKSQIAAIINILEYFYSLLKWVLELSWSWNAKLGGLEINQMVMGKWSSANGIPDLAALDLKHAIVSYQNMSNIRKSTYNNRQTEQ